MRIDVKNVPSGGSSRLSPADESPSESQPKPAFSKAIDAKTESTCLASVSAVSAKLAEAKTDVEEGELLSADEEHETHSPEDAWKLNLPTASTAALQIASKSSSSSCRAPQRRSTASEEGELVDSDGQASPPQPSLSKPAPDDTISALDTRSSSGSYGAPAPSTGVLKVSKPPPAAGVSAQAQAPQASAPIVITSSSSLESASCRQQHESLSRRPSSRPEYVFKVKTWFDPSNPPPVECFMYESILQYSIWPHTAVLTPTLLCTRG